eukprot:10764770-Alexandrium_andersonii.AAC.1
MFARSPACSLRHLRAAVDFPAASLTHAHGYQRNGQCVAAGPGGCTCSVLCADRALKNMNQGLVEGMGAHRGPARGLGGDEVVADES